MVPLRFIGEQLGADISWDQAERKIGYKLEDKTVELWIDKNIASVNGIEILIDENPLIVPIIRSGRTFVPVRFIVEALGFEIEWNGETNEVMVQDYNSSRSNKPSPIAERIGEGDGDDSEDKEPGKAEAQDYNSSRSNKPSPIAESIGDDKDEDQPTGVHITWDSIEMRAIYKLKGIIIELWVEKDLVLVNGIQTKINEKDPTIILNKENDSQLDPIHFMSRVSGYIFEWNPATKELTIRKG